MPSPSASQADLTVGAIKINGQVPDGKDDCKDGKNTVTVVVKEINSLTIYVLGQVKSSGALYPKSRVRLLQAISMAGGFTDLAKPNKVVVLRNTPTGPQRIKINIKQVVADEGGAPFYLQTLDTVYVE